MLLPAWEASGSGLDRGFCVFGFCSCGVGGMEEAAADETGISLCNSCFPPAWTAFLAVLGGAGEDVSSGADTGDGETAVGLVSAIFCRTTAALGRAGACSGSGVDSSEREPCSKGAVSATAPGRPGSSLGQSSRRLRDGSGVSGLSASGVAISVSATGGSTGGAELPCKMATATRNPKANKPIINQRRRSAGAEGFFWEGTWVLLGFIA